MDPALLKQTFKSAILEALQESNNDLSKPEHRAELTDLLTGVFEDIGLGFAMQEVKDTTPVPREQVMQVMQGKKQ